MNASPGAVLAQKLPLPNPEEWCTRAAAAGILGCDPGTVGRMIRANRLRSYSPLHVPDETAPILLWLPEVNALAEARRIAREGVH